MTDAVLFGLAALVVVVGARWAAKRTGIPSTVLLAVLGAIYGLLPGPNVALRPHLVLATIIPPLLYGAALDASLLDIRHYFRPIASLSVGLVLATALGIGAALPLAVPSIGFAAALALGAAVAPPDPVAALSIGRRIGLPQKLTTVIEGEGLLNDATALTTLEVAAAAATGAGFSVGFAVARFVISAVGGLVVGAVVAWVLGRLKWSRNDALLANAVSLGTPFLCYLVGEELHVSGVLAVVVAGLVAGHRAPRVETSSVRLQVTAVWRLVGFLLEGLVFLLIGQQLPPVLQALHRYSPGSLVAATAATLGVVLFLRPIWLGTTQLLPRRFSIAADSSQRRWFSKRELTILSWSGTRGVITLAAAYSLPRALPNRELLLYCAFVVVAVTLVGQGLTYAPLARWLRLHANYGDASRQRNKARLAAIDAALGHLDELDDVDEPVRAELRRSLLSRRARYRHWLDSIHATGPGQPAFSETYLAAQAARRAVIETERGELLRWRETDRISETDLRALQKELDHQESQVPTLSQR